jgi:putative FmdB family regulatory protein
MPIYVYVCSKCKEELEVLQSIKDEPLKLCHKCNMNTLDKKVTNASFSFKGTGYYCTDFKNKK